MSHYYGTLYRELTRFPQMQAADLPYGSLAHLSPNVQLKSKYDLVEAHQHEVSGCTAFREMTPFFFPANTNETIKEVANSHWSMWQPICPPFQKCFLEFEASLFNERAASRLKIFSDETGFGKIWRVGAAISNTMVSFSFMGQKKAFITPMMLVMKEDRSSAEYAPDTLGVWGWGYDKAYGNGQWPPFDTAFAGSTLGKDLEMRMCMIGKDAAYEMDDWLAEGMVHVFEGIAKYTLAALAILNAPRASELTFAKTPSRMIKDKIVRYPDLRLVVVKPNTPRKVYEHARANNQPAHPKRLHDVRQHLRRYKTGKIVVVRSHQRGDEELGVVKKQYIVEDNQNA